MWNLLRRSAVHEGLVLFPGTLPPPPEQLDRLGPAGVTAATVPPPPPFRQAVKLEHPAWGTALALFSPDLPLPDRDWLRWSASLTAEERRLAESCESGLAVRLETTEREVLRARKQLLRWLRLVGSLGAGVVFDIASELFWSPAMLDDELSHDGDLDVEALYTIHAVYEEADRRVFWLHTHGLEALGAFDLDVLNPSPGLARSAADPIRALAYAAIEGHITASTAAFPLASPGGTVALVPVAEFDATAAPEHRALRQPDAAHSGRRAVVCATSRGLLSVFRRRPVPSPFLSNLDGPAAFNFSKAATSLMADRARQTLKVFAGLLAEFPADQVMPVVKIGYATAQDPTGREHLWFQVHRFVDDGTVEATLLNAPFDVPTLHEGMRGCFPLDELSDWMVMSPAGPMTPRNLSAARTLRAALAAS